MTGKPPRTSPRNLWIGGRRSNARSGGLAMRFERPTGAVMGALHKRLLGRLIDQSELGDQNIEFSV
jgi:hypothetical protein